MNPSEGASRALAYRKRRAERDLHAALTQLAEAIFWLNNPDPGQPQQARQDLADKCMAYAIDRGATAPMINYARYRGDGTERYRPAQATFLSWSKKVRLTPHRIKTLSHGLRVRRQGDIRYQRIPVPLSAAQEWLHTNGFQAAGKHVITHRDLTRTVVVQWQREGVGGIDHAQIISTAER